jgi:hypothetical protein
MDDLEKIPIEEDFEVDGDCGEYDTYIAYSEGFLLTIDRIFFHQRDSLNLTEEFMKLDGLGRTTGVMSLERLVKYKVIGLSRAKKIFLQAKKEGKEDVDQPMLNITLLFLNETLNPSEPKS